MSRGTNHDGTRWRIVERHLALCSPLRLGEEAQLPRGCSPATTASKAAYGRVIHHAGSHTDGAARWRAFLVNASRTGAALTRDMNGDVAIAKLLEPARLGLGEMRHWIGASGREPFCSLTSRLSAPGEGTYYGPVDSKNRQSRR